MSNADMIPINGTIFRQFKIAKNYFQTLEYFQDGINHSRANGRRLVDPKKHTKITVTELPVMTSKKCWEISAMSSLRSELSGHALTHLRTHECTHALTQAHTYAWCVTHTISP